jgi:hypothetical protein
VFLCSVRLRPVSCVPTVATVSGLTITMYVYCVYPAMSKKSENLSDLNKKDRNKRHSSPFINVVKGVFFVVRDTLVPV